MKETKMQFVKVKNKMRDCNIYYGEQRRRERKHRERKRRNTR